MDATGDRNNRHERAPRPYKVAVVGAGKVGSTFVYALLLNGLVGEIALIDIDHKRAEGEAMDLNHAVPLSNPARIWVGDYLDCAGADVVVVAAGTGQYIFCGSGLRAMTAASQLRNAGWENLTTVLGGLAGWSSVSCPLE
jgi:rhodanese-related sulfurtransferase